MSIIAPLESRVTQPRLDGPGNDPNDIRQRECGWASAEPQATRICARGIEVCTLFYEDMTPGEPITSPTVVVDRDEMVAFAKRWDPMPFHVDEASGRAAFGGITAPGLFVLAIKQQLIHQLPDKQAVIASLGYDELRFHAPVRPNDILHLKFECTSRRESNTKADRGVVTVRLSLINQAGVTVMSHLDTILVRRRNPRADPK